MTNYMKSEWYRIIHSNTIYVVTAIMVLLSVLVNIVLALFLNFTPDFSYGTFRFSLNIITAQLSILLMAAGVIAVVFFAGEVKNGVVKNVIAYGISRKNIFVGQTIICFCICLMIMTVTIVTYVGSAYLLLEEPEWEPFRQLLKGTGAMLLSAVASMAFMLILNLIFTKESTAIIVWVAVLFVVPQAAMILGMKLELFATISSLMPYTMLKKEVLVTMSTYQCLWNEPAGLVRCLIVGMLGILILSGVGMWKFRKTDI